MNSKYFKSKSSSKVLIEDGELYKDRYGNILESSSFSHDDDFIKDEYGNVIDSKDNGGELVDAESVVSASYDQVKSGDRKLNGKEKLLKFSPKDANKLLQDRGLSWFKTKKHMSGSELIKEATKQTQNKFNKQYASQNDQYSQNAKKLNLQQTPTEEDIYDIVFSEQERKKSSSGLKFDDTAQYGGMAAESTATRRPIRNPNFEIIPDDQIVESTTATPVVQKAYTAKNYPDIKIRYPDPNSPDTYKHSNGQVRASFNSRSRTAYLPKENDGDGLDLAAELAHAQQLDSLGVDRMEQTTLQEKNAYGERTYEIPGTIEYDAHKNREAPIQDDFQNYVTTTRRGARQRTNGQLAGVLGRTHPNSLQREWLGKGDMEVGLMASSPKIKTRKFTKPKEDDFINQFKSTLKQYGGEGIPESLEGLNEYPEQPVMVPSGDITMEGINYSVDAYDGNTGEWLEEMQPEQDYNFNTDKVLEIPKAQAGYDRTSTVPAKKIKIQGTTSELDPTPNANGEFVDQFGKVWIKDSSGGFVPANKTATPPNPANKPQLYQEYLEAPDDNYTVRKGDWMSSIAPMFGLTTEELIALNPELEDSNKIAPGQKLKIRNLPPQPVDRAAEITDIQQLPDQVVPVETAEETPTLDIKAETVAPPTKNNEVAKALEDVLKNTKLGKINRNVGTNALREMMRANRSINLPYRMEVPNRQLNYNEIDATPYLDEVDSQVNQQLQYVNQNTSQGQAILNNVMARGSQNKRQLLNRLSGINLQSRNQTNNANTQLLNQYDMMQEQSNAQYVEGVNQTLSNYDRGRVQQADYLDQMINNRSREDNAFLMMNIKYNNIEIDPITGEIIRKATPWNNPTPPPVKNAAKWGLKKRH